MVDRPPPIVRQIGRFVYAHPGDPLRHNGQHRPGAPSCSAVSLIMCCRRGCQNLVASCDVRILGVRGRRVPELMGGVAGWSGHCASALFGRAGFRELCGSAVLVRVACVDEFPMRSSRDSWNVRWRPPPEPWGRRDGAIADTELVFVAVAAPRPSPGQSVCRLAATDVNARSCHCVRHQRCQSTVGAPCAVGRVTRRKRNEHCREPRRGQRRQRRGAAGRAAGVGRGARRPRSSGGGRAASGSRARTAARPCTTSSGWAPSTRTGRRS